MQQDHRDSTLTSPHDHLGQVADNEIEEDDSLKDNNDSPLEDYNPRLGFVRKVYGIISCQLLFTVIWTTVCHRLLINYLLQQDKRPIDQLGLKLYFLALLVYLISSLIISYVPKVARKVPINYFLLSLLTVSISYLVGFFTIFFSPKQIILAAVLTLTLTIVLTIYAFTTKRDITMYGAAKWMSGWVLIMASFLFFWLDFPGNENYTVFRTFTGVIIYGFYLVYNTQTMMGGKGYEFSVDDYVLAAMRIYVDIIVLFLRILKILAKIRRR